MWQYRFGAPSSGPSWPGRSVAAYTEVRDRLVDELGVDPGSALRELETRILDHDPSLAAEPPRLPRAPGLPFVSGNLAEPLSSFLGRDAELEQVCEAVDSSRFVTLIGPGGVGKTRLAVEVAGRWREQQPGGAWLIELGGVTNPQGVAPAAAGTLGAFGPALSDAQPSGSTAELIARHLTGRSLVVVLDNYEHVIDAAAALAHTLVGKVPGLRLVATSREPLGVPGEILIPIGGLASPAAIELFVDRARAVQPGFDGDSPAESVIDGICRRLDRARDSGRLLRLRVVACVHDHHDPRMERPGESIPPPPCDPENRDPAPPSRRERASRLRQAGSRPAGGSSGQ